MTAFDALFAPTELRAAVSARAWLASMVAFERALAVAGREVGLVPADAAETIVRACETADFDVDSIWLDGQRAGNPAEPLVRALRSEVGEAERYVHLGSTSQDVIDTAAMLVARGALTLVSAELDAVADCCAGLAERYRATPVVGRTLLQQAVPTTFGLKAAGWLDRVVDARGALFDAGQGLAVQLGGAAGTLSGYGEDGVRVLELVASELGLAVPPLPWHSSRGRIAKIGGALTATAGAASGIAFDIVLLAQTEVGEVAEAVGGGSSAMPHKQNPTQAVVARGAGRVAIANASVLCLPVDHEHERAAGAWHAEWEALSSSLLYTGAAVAALSRSLGGLRVNVDRMRANLELTGGLVFSEHVADALTPVLGRGAAQSLVTEAAARTSDTITFKEALLELSGEQLTADRIDELLDPTSIVDSSSAFIDRMLARYRGRRE